MWDMMIRWIRPSLAVGLFAAGMLSLSTAPVSAFSRETVSPDGGNYSFGDPDKQVTNSDKSNSGQTTRPFGSDGPTFQFHVQQGPVTSFGQNNRYGTPDPYFRPLNGN
jgi:hypothetical protein